MTLSNRTKISLKQLLGIIDIGVVDDILKKHNITNINNMGGDITDFIQEIVETKSYLKNHIATRIEKNQQRLLMSDGMTLKNVCF